MRPAALGMTAWLWVGAVPALAQAPDEHSGHHPDGSPTGSAPLAAPAVPAAPALPAAAPAAGDEHSAHHPAGGTAAGATNPGGATAGMMGGMMGMMGRATKPLYPSLMSLPDLTPQQRETFRTSALERVSRGSVLLAQSQRHLQGALTAGNATETALALGHVREALEQLESGSTMLRALDEGRPPPQIALDWFRGQLNLRVPGVGSHAEPGSGPFGLSWFHLVSMAALVTFATVMAALSVGRLRRANALVRRLSVPPSVPAAAPVPVASLSPAAPPSAAPPAEAQAKAPPGPALPAGGRGGRWSGSLRVAAIFPETPNVRTFRLMATDGEPIPFIFRPGQFLDVSIPVESGTVKRSYTIASAPTRRDFVEITVKREEAGVISRHLHDRVVVGDLLSVTAPAGTFTFSGTEADSVVLIGGGVGITPLMSVIRHLTDRAWPGEIILIYCARTTQDFIYRDELEALQRRHRNLQIVATMTRAEGTAWVGLQGYVTRELIQQAVPDVAKRRVHVCGPPAMMDAVRTQLEALGVPKAQIKTEAFATSGAVLPIQPPVTTPATAAPQVPSAPQPPTGPATATIRFSLSGKTAPLAPDRTVLEAAESAGVAIDNSCRVGTCGTCKVKLLDGQVTMEVEDGLEPDDKADGLVLACQAKSIGNLVVEA